MNRKEFLGKSIQAGMIPLAINGFGLKAFADSPLIQFLNKAGNEDRVLVLVQLNGGNDGLNTVIPLDQYSKYYSARTNIAIPENKVLSLSGNAATGLHPSMTHINNLFSDGKIGIIQNVGYPNQDFSHFRSTDIWLTASDANKNEDTGWMGRYLDTKFPGFPTGYPNATHPDPPAIQIGAMISPALQGSEMSMGISITDPSNFYQFINGTVDPAPNTPMGHELTFIRLVAQQTQQYAGSIKSAADKVVNKSTKYPTAGTNTLADQLKIVARLVAGGLKTRVYMVSLGGFDTHATQVVAGSTDTGTHATLLSRISAGVDAFQDDLKLLSIEDRVLGMTFSEFGRRIRSNDSLGTDHGAAAPLFLFGKKLNGGIYGKNPFIPDSPSGGDNIPMEFDFRSVYATVLKDWFEVSDTDLQLVLKSNFPSIPFVQTGSTSLQENDAFQSLSLVCYPNPTQDFVNIQFIGLNQMVQISLFNQEGKELMPICNELYDGAKHEIRVDTRSLASGVYYIQMIQAGKRQSKKLVVSH
ncbi:MAG: DUF1501 domain-containing protein [Bacteroidota bacterium]|nr:DUF1501 domain-containing protein [Bacteroidota bacterium]